jgi:hypothetical protein
MRELGQLLVVGMSVYAEINAAKARHGARWRGELPESCGVDDETAWL